MDYNTIIQAIGSVGFPIVACMYMAWLHNDSEVRHSEERANLTKAINDLTIVVTLIKDRLHIEEGDDV